MSARTPPEYLLTLAEFASSATLSSLNGLGVTVWGREVTRRLYDGLMRLEDIIEFRKFADTFTL